MARDQIDMTPLQSRDELVAWFEAGCKPASEWRMGTEHEKTPFTLEGHRPVPSSRRVPRFICLGRELSVGLALLVREC